MFKHVNFRRAFALALPAIAALVLAGGVSASPAPTLSFSASHDGASAGWSQGRGSPIELKLGDSAGTFAVINLHHDHGIAVGDLSAPSFTTSEYAAGSPRFYITLSDGNSLWGYPSQSGLNDGNFAWTINNGNTYTSWAGVQATEGNATVTAAYVIADADQAAGTTDEITGLSFGGIDYN
jgi:hypothetical protein